MKIIFFLSRTSNVSLKGQEWGGGGIVECSGFFSRIVGLYLPVFPSK
jgi:hypothetical protein